MEPLTKGVLLGAGGVLLAGVLLGACCRGGPGYWGHRGDMYGSSAHARWGDHPQALVSGVSRQLWTRRSVRDWRRWPGWCRRRWAH